MKASGLACEISDGTALGAVKFQGQLPWEVDADVSIEQKNMTAFKKIVGPAVKKYGFRFVSTCYMESVFVYLILTSGEMVFMCFYKATVVHMHVGVITGVRP